MALGYEITFMPGRRTIRFTGSDFNYYRLPDGNEIGLASRPIWCDGCAKVSHGEAIPSLSDIDQAIASLKRLAGEIRREIDPEGDGSQQDQIAELSLARTWRSLRQSPPRCMVCGSCNIISLEQNKPIRTGNDTILLKAVGLIDTICGSSYFTAEGERIHLPDDREPWPPPVFRGGLH